MKRIWLLLFLFVSPIIVNADDKVVIDEYDTYITVVGDHTYYYYDTYNIKITPGEQQHTYYVVGSISKTGSYIYRDKTYEYTNDIGVIDVKSAHNHFFLSDDKDYLIYFGTDVRFFSKEDVVKFSYDVKQIGEKLEYVNDLNFIVAQSKYDINKVTFKIVLPEDSRKWDVHFSVNGIDYYSDMNTLEYTYEDNIIEGEYNKLITSENKLYIRLEDKTSINYREIIVYSFIIMVLTVLIYTLKSGVFKNNAKV